MRRLLPFLIVGLVALVTLASATVLYRAKRPTLLTISKDRLGEKENGDSAHILGSPNATVTLEEFGDFQCPPCAALCDPLNQLEKEYRPRLRVTFRHFPLVTHAHAQEAACAAEAAGMQGRFWEMHDLLYREQAVWSKAADAPTLFNSYAGMLGLNLDRFKKDLDSDQVKTRVASDQKRGVELGVKSTPTIFVNNRELAPTSLNPADLRKKIDAVVKEKTLP